MVPWHQRTPSRKRKAACARLRPFPCRSESEEEAAHAEQGIRQVWITSHFGVLSKRPPSADERFLLIKAIFTPRSLGCKAPFRRVFRPAAVQALVLSSPNSAQAGAASAIDVAMQQVASDIWLTFERRLERARVSAPQRPDYHNRTMPIRLVAKAARPQPRPCTRHVPATYETDTRHALA